MANNKQSVRATALQENINLKRLTDILELRREAGSNTEDDFVVSVLDPIPNMQQDDFGNRFLRIGEAPILWSCHTDTVTRGEGKQALKWDGDILKLDQGKPGQCLGADDGAGLWLMLEMIDAKKEGLYVFHREEEIGGNGSASFRTTHAELLGKMDYAIAFDRRKTGSIITHQRGGRCCSDTFGTALANLLNGAVEGLEYKLDTGGSFTDTANYTKIIAECTNVSVGYDKEHGPLESLDVAHLLRLRAALLKIDVSTLPVERDPSKVESNRWGGYGGNWFQTYNKSPKARLAEVVRENYYEVAGMLMAMGVTDYGLKQSIRAQMLEEIGSPLLPDYADAELEDAADDDQTTEYLFCHNCDALVEEHFQFFNCCETCESTNTEWMTVNEAQEMAVIA